MAAAKTWLRMRASVFLNAAYGGLVVTEHFLMLKTLLLVYEGANGMKPLATERVM